MLVEAKAAFYNEETGAVQPWRDIEVTDTLGNELVSEGLAKAIEGGGGGGGDYKTANVTIVCDQEDGSFSLSVDQENSEYTGFFDKGDGAFNYEAFGNYGTPAVVKLLYSSDSGVYLIPYTTITSVTGDAVIDDGCALVTGDCTITGNSN